MSCMMHRLLRPKRVIGPLDSRHAAVFAGNSEYSREEERRSVSDNVERHGFMKDGKEE